MCDLGVDGFSGCELLNNGNSGRPLLGQRSSLCRGELLLQVHLGQGGDGGGFDDNGSACVGH